MPDSKLLEALSNDSCFKSALFQSHWYNFYNNAYSELVASHAALFGGLIAVTIALFAFKYWMDHKKFDEDVKKEIEKIKNNTQAEFKEKLDKAESRINSLERRCSELINQPQKFYIKSIMDNKGRRNINALVLSAITKWLDSSIDKELTALMLIDFKDLFDQIKQSIKQPLDNDEKIKAKEISKKMNDFKNNNVDEGLLLGLQEMKM